jgi:L,D-peptidoglycan transpeptidase YkuD (ErfK/YbiS/YcfS/YnhG family)
MRERRKSVATLFIRALSQSARRGHVQFGSLSVPCALGRSGVKALKREGDGATPRGRFRLRYVLYREGTKRPLTALGLRLIRRDDGWSDSPSDRNYNRKVRLPYGASAEHLWREDGLYDLVAVLGYNDMPRIRNRGSAIFMHIARSDFRPTEGCVALRGRDLRRLISRLPKQSDIVILV